MLINPYEKHISYHEAKGVMFFVKFALIFVFVAIVIHHLEVVGVTVIVFRVKESSCYSRAKRLR